MNHADALTRWKQDLDSQMAAKITLCTQTLLEPERLDPRILAELSTDQLLEVCPIQISELETPEPDLVDSLLQANRTLLSLQKYCGKARDSNNPWTLEDGGLLKHQEWLVVAEEQNLCTRLIAEVHAQVSTTHPGKNKTRKIIGSCYYWLGMTADINRYVRNCVACCMSTIPWDKTPGLLKPLLIPKHS